MFAAKAASRLAAPRLAAAARRPMSGDAAEAAIEMAKWTKYSYAAIAGVTALTCYVGVIEYQHLMHPHPHEVPAYSHLKIRSKPYPWDCPDCNLFEPACWKACKENA
mmetsp:Transcript_142/g.374  ORF Transcript_142/g.374 Transcript_142/m.374 type:complete len:107 (-) Transcript_142:44-364(-)